MDRWSSPAPFRVRHDNPEVLRERKARRAVGSVRPKIDVHPVSVENMVMVPTQTYGPCHRVAFLWHHVARLGACLISEMRPLQNRQSVRVFRNPDDAGATPLVVAPHHRVTDNLDLRDFRRSLRRLRRTPRQTHDRRSPEGPDLAPLDAGTAGSRIADSAGSPPSAPSP